MSSGTGSLFVCINVASDRQQQAEEDAVVSFSFKLDVRWGITPLRAGWRGVVAFPALCFSSESVRLALTPPCAAGGRGGRELLRFVEVPPAAKFKPRACLRL